MQKKIHYLFIIPFLVCALLFGISCLGIYKGLEQTVYDFFLLLTSVNMENKQLLLVEAEPPAGMGNGLNYPGTGSIARNNLAEGLILLKEFAAQYAVISQEFATESMYQRNPKQFDADLKKLFFSISHDPGEKDLFKHVEKIYKNDDEYFAQAARFFGNTYVGIKTVKRAETNIGLINSEKESNEYLYNKITLHNLEVVQDSLPIYEGIQPAILPILTGSKGTGFINYMPDKDSITRKVNLVIKYKNYYIPELGFSALLDWLGQPKVVLLDEQLILKNARHPQKGVKDLNIPLTEDKSLLIHWADHESQTSWRRVTFEDFINNHQLEERLLHQLSLMQAKGYLAVYQKSADWFNLYASTQVLLREMLASGSLNALSDYREKRKFFFAEVQNFLKAEVEQKVIQSMKEVLASGAVSQTDLALYRTIQGEIPEDFKNARTNYEQLANLRKLFTECLPGAFCLIGYAAKDSAAKSLLPFEQEIGLAYVQANIINTILTNQFLTYLPWWYAMLVAFSSAVFAMIIGARLRPRGVIWLGSGLSFVLLLGCAVVFLFTNMLLNPLMPFIAILLTVIIVFLYQLNVINKRKNFLHRLFFTSLSQEAWTEFLKTPNSFSLGGERKYLTAFSSEMQDFSNVAGLLGPQELVSLLNTYLAEISNLVLEQKGTVIKFENAAIIGLFGTPLPVTDHARRACFAATRIKKIEKYLSDQLLAKKLVSAPLLTGVGISTGEMIVGNLGTEKKIDYSAFGPYFNLALNLKGMNLYYKTQILIDESTYLEGGYDFYVRMLDKVRQAGIKNPIRIYELIDEKHRVDAHIKEGVEVFHEGMHQFEKREWEKAEKIFQKAVRIIPNDYPATVLSERCQKYKKEPPPAQWNNVFNLK